MNTINIFKNNFDYIEYITSLPLRDDEVICSNFIPSAFFQKDVIDYFFQKKEYLDNHKLASEKLWNYGKNILKYLKKGKIQIGIEFNSLNNFIEKGIVHEATPNFETSLATRIQVIDTFLNFFENIYFIPEPIPYVFRLIPTNKIILDVDRNKTEQSIQGILIQDNQAYNDFKDEFERLKRCSINLIDKEKLKKLLIVTKLKLSSGVIVNLKTKDFSNLLQKSK